MKYYVIRGGNWYSNVTCCLQPSRSLVRPDFYDNSVGFRLTKKLKS